MLQVLGQIVELEVLVVLVKLVGGDWYLFLLEEVYLVGNIIMVCFVLMIGDLVLCDLLNYGFSIEGLLLGVCVQFVVVVGLQVMVMLDCDLFGLFLLNDGSVVVIFVIVNDFGLGSVNFIGNLLGGCKYISWLINWLIGICVQFNMMNNGVIYVCFDDGSDLNVFGIVDISFFGGWEVGMCVVDFIVGMGQDGKLYFGFIVLINSNVVIFDLVVIFLVDQLSLWFNYVFGWLGDLGDGFVVNCGLVIDSWVQFFVYGGIFYCYVLLNRVIID